MLRRTAVLLAGLLRALSTSLLFGSSRIVSLVILLSSAGPLAFARPN